MGRIDAEKEKAMRQIFGDTFTDRLLADAEQVEKDADAAGVAWKSTDGQLVRFKVIDHTTKASEPVPAARPIVSHAITRLTAIVALARQAAPDNEIEKYIDDCGEELKRKYGLSSGTSGGHGVLHDNEKPVKRTKETGDPVGPLEWIDSFLLTSPRPAVTVKAAEPTFFDWLTPGAAKGGAQ
jgi:hypothetical protein